MAGGIDVARRGRGRSSACRWRSRSHPWPSSGKRATRAAADRWPAAAAGDARGIVEPCPTEAGELADLGREIDQCHAVGVGAAAATLLPSVSQPRAVRPRARRKGMGTSEGVGDGRRHVAPGRRRHASRPGARRPFPQARTRPVLRCSCETVMVGNLALKSFALLGDLHRHLARDRLVDRGDLAVGLGDDGRVAASRSARGSTGSAAARRGSRPCTARPSACRRRRRRCARCGRSSGTRRRAMFSTMPEDRHADLLEHREALAARRSARCPAAS